MLHADRMLDKNINRLVTDLSKQEIEYENNFLKVEATLALLDLKIKLSEVVDSCRQKILPILLSSYLKRLKN